MVLASAVAGFALTAAPASADAAPAPWFHGGAGTWGAFTISGSVPSGGTVTLNRSFGGATDASAVFDSVTLPDGRIVWPDSGTAGSLSFHHVGEPCLFSDSSCSYDVTGSSFSGTIASGDPPPEGFPSSSVTIEAPPTLPPTSTPTPTTAPQNVGGTVTFTPGVGGAPGTATFNAGTSVGPNGAIPDAFVWTLNAAGQPTQTFTCATPQCTPPPNVTLNPGTTYAVTLQLMKDGQPLGTPAQAELPVPADPPADPNPGGGSPPGGGGTPSGGGGTPSAGGSGGGSGGGGSGAGVFARPVSRVPSALTGGFGAAAPTIVWLWRPDFYQAQTLPQTGGVCPSSRARPTSSLRRDPNPPGQAPDRGWPGSPCSPSPSAGS